MRILRTVVVLILIASLAGNAILYKKSRGRVQVRVGDEAITNKQIDAFLYMRFGVPTLAQLVGQSLVEQACKKANLKIDMAEIDELLTEAKQASPDLAAIWKRLPYKEEDKRNEARTRLGMMLLQTKDVTATPDEIQAFFDAVRAQLNKPDQIEIKAVRCNDAETAERAEQLLKSGIDDMVVLQRQIGTSADVLGLDGKFVLSKPFQAASRDPLVNRIAAMKDGEVGRAPAAPGQRKILVIRRIGMTPGRQVTLDEVRPKVERLFKLTRAVPDKEVLRKLWSDAKIETDDPRTKAEIEYMLFRDPIARQ